MGIDCMGVGGHGNVKINFRSSLVGLLPFSHLEFLSRTLNRENSTSQHVDCRNVLST